MNPSMSSIQFSFGPSENASEAVLKMDSSFRASGELKGKDAEKLWKKILAVADEFRNGESSDGPTIVFGLTGG